MNEPTPNGCDTGRADDGPQRLSSGMWWVIGLLASSTFVAGLAGGILIDGTVEVINRFNARSARSCVPTRAERAVVVDARGSIVRQAEPAIARMRANNEIDWLISVAPGTPTARIGIRNADPEHGARLDFGTAEGTGVKTAATIWIDAAGTGNLSLPLGRYAIRTQRLDASQSPDGPPATVRGPMALASPDDAPTIVGSSSGRWLVNGLKEPAPGAPKRRRRRSGSDEEYRNLGPPDSGGTSPTYG